MPGAAGDTHRAVTPPWRAATRDSSFPPPGPPRWLTNEELLHPVGCLVCLRRVRRSPGTQCRHRTRHQGCAVATGSNPHPDDPDTFTMSPPRPGRKGQRSLIAVVASDYEILLFKQPKITESVVSDLLRQRLSSPLWVSVMLCPICASRAGPPRRISRRSPLRPSGRRRCRPGRRCSRGPLHPRTGGP